MSLVSTNRLYLLNVSVSILKAIVARFLQALQVVTDVLSDQAPPVSRLVAHWEDRDWVVYAKRPFAGPQQTLDYVGRYTHRVPIAVRSILKLPGPLSIE